MPKYSIYIILITFSSLTLLFCSSSKSNNDVVPQEEITPVTILSQDVYNIEDYGAIPNDGKNDSKAIQKAIDAALKSADNKPTIIKAGAGVFDLDEGLVFSRRKDNKGEYKHITFTFSGAMSGYATDQRIGKTTVLRLRKPIFGIAVQLGRNCVIENLVIEGKHNFSAKKEDILKQNENTFSNNENVRTNSYSPSCGIVIDPFHANIPQKDRYTGCNGYYQNKNRGGTSMLLIRGCSFMNHYIGIANNPSANVQNGDNISAEQCHVTKCHTFWSAGQSQSRANSINNVYSLFVNTFISCRQIGSKQGTPPMIRNINLAGFCKYLIDMNTGFSGFSAYQSYFESIWSLGMTNANFASFNQCQIKFVEPSENVKVAPAHLVGNCVVSFNDCSIEYFANCKERIPFMFKTKHVNINGGKIEGGVVLADCITNTGGENLHNVSFSNVMHKCEGTKLSDKLNGVLLTNLYNRAMVGGTDIITNKGKNYTIKGNTYQLDLLEKKTIIKKHDETTYFFLSKNARNYRVNDNLLSGTWITVGHFIKKDMRLRPSLGFVSKIEGNTIFIKGYTEGILGQSIDIYRCGFHTLIPEIKGNTVKGENRIKKHTLAKSATKLKIGTRIIHPHFPKNTIITNITANYLELNNKAIKTGGINITSCDDK